MEYSFELFENMCDLSSDPLDECDQFRWFRKEKKGVHFFLRALVVRDLRVTNSTPGLLFFLRALEPLVVRDFRVTNSAPGLHFFLRALEPLVVRDFRVTNSTPGLLLSTLH
jgi:hypothetical protein